jgi:hypothetical protein
LDERPEPVDETPSSSRRESKGLSFPADDRGLGIFGLVIGVATFFLADLQAAASSALIPGSENPVIQGTFYPRMVSVLIVVSSIVLIATETVRLRMAGDPERWMLSKLPHRVVGASLGLLVAVALSALALEPLGFIVPSAILATFLARWFGAPSWLKAGACALVASIVVYVLFTVVFKSPLPQLLRL